MKAPRGAHLRLWSLAILCTGLLACGGGSKEASEAGPHTEAVAADPSTVTLHVAIELPDTLARATEAWAAARSARIEWVRAADVATPVTLREVQADALDALLADGALRAFSVAGEARLGELWLDEVGRREGRTHGLPWRARLHALRGAGDLDWAALARLDRALLLQEEQLTDTFLALAASTGELDDGALDAGAEAVTEALAFLTDLCARATLASAADLGRAGGSSNETTGGPSGWAAMQVDPRAGEHWRALPASSIDSSGAVLARPYLLVLPRGGDHLDLGDELALWLTEPAQMELLFSRDPARTPLLRALDSNEAAERAVLALRPFAVPAPFRGVDAPRWMALLDEAVRAAVEQRRHPAAALADAARRRIDRTEP